MKYKKIMILAIFLVSLLAISAASAADNTTEVIIVNAGEDVVSVENNNLTVEQTENEETIGATDDGTFTELQEMINNAESGSTITLEKDYAYDEGFKTSGISISKDIAIDGKGHMLNAFNKSRIFNLHAVDFTLNNVKLYNGYSEDDGGAIYAAPGGLMGDDFIIKVNNCIFENNAGYYGSAIYCQSINIKNSIFANNVAITTYYGGSIYVFNNIFAENCNFINNSGTYGGAINIHGGTVDGVYYNLNIVNCNFTNNIASKYGGAIYSFNDESLLNITSCIFDSNDADYGGALYCCGVFVVDDSEFNCNDAIYGGAIYFSASSSSTVRSSGYTTYYSYISIAVNSDFINNAAADGGAIYCNGGSDKLSAVNCIFRGNCADIYGGAIYKGSAENCVFVNNTIENGDGGAIYCGSAKDCVFVNNTAEDYGGAI